MRGYEVVTSDRRTVGRVADVKGGYLIAESGWLRRSRRPIPREFAHCVDETETVVVTVPMRVLQDAPKVDRHGRFDAQQAARHYGLAELHARPRPEGEGGMTLHDPARRAGRERPGHRRGSPALSGDQPDRHVKGE